MKQILLSLAFAAAGFGLGYYRGMVKGAYMALLHVRSYLMKVKGWKMEWVTEMLSDINKTKSSNV